MKPGVEKSGGFASRKTQTAGVWGFDHMMLLEIYFIVGLGENDGCEYSSIKSPEYSPFNHCVKLVMSSIFISRVTSTLTEGI